MDFDPDLKETILKTHCDLSADTLETFERIGRRQLYYKLCLQDSHGFRALRRCPYSEQIKFAAEPVPMLLLREGDGPDELAVSVSAMSREQVKQVFGPRRVRTLAEQRTWLQAQPVPPRTVEVAKPYTVRRGKVTFHEAVTLTAQDLARLLAEIA